MNRPVKPTRALRSHYEKLRYCLIVDVLWDKRDGKPLPVLVLSTPSGGTAECIVVSAPERLAPGYLHHNI